MRNVAKCKQHAVQRDHHESLNSPKAHGLPGRGLSRSASQQPQPPLPSAGSAGGGGGQQPPASALFVYNPIRRRSRQVALNSICSAPRACNPRACHGRRFVRRQCAFPFCSLNPPTSPNPRTSPNQSHASLRFDPSRPFALFPRERVTRPDRRLANPHPPATTRPISPFRLIDKAAVLGLWWQ